MNEVVYMTLKRAGTVLAQNLPCQLDTVNIPIQFMGRSDIPVDLYALASLGWNTPAPQRQDYFIDQATNTAYQVYGNPYVADGTVQCQVTKYLGGTP